MSWVFSEIRPFPACPGQLLLTSLPPCASTTPFACISTFLQIFPSKNNVFRRVLRLRRPLYSGRRNWVPSKSTFFNASFLAFRATFQGPRLPICSVFMPKGPLPMQASICLRHVLVKSRTAHCPKARFWNASFLGSGATYQRSFFNASFLAFRATFQGPGLPICSAFMPKGPLPMQASICLTHVLVNSRTGHCPKARF